MQLVNLTILSLRYVRAEAMTSVIRGVTSTMLGPKRQQATAKVNWLPGRNWRNFHFLKQRDFV